MKKFILFTLSLILLGNCFVYSQYVEYWTPVTLNLCEGDTFALFNNQQPFNKFKSVYDENCVPHQITNEPNWDEFIISGGNKIEQKDTLYKNVCGDPCSYAVIFYIKFKATQSTTITISTSFRWETDYGKPECNPNNYPPIVTSTRVFTYNIQVYPLLPKPSISVQTLQSDPNAPEIIQLTATGCATDDYTYWSAVNPETNPFYNQTNSITTDKTYDCGEYKVSCYNRFCPNYKLNWSDPFPTNNFSHNQNNPGYSTNFAKYFQDQAQKSRGKPEYAYRRQFACIQQKSMNEFNNTGENGWAGGFIKHLFDSFAKGKICEGSQNYTCKIYDSQAYCLLETGFGIHAAKELAPGFFTYQPNYSAFTEAISQWNSQHDGFLENAVLPCFSELYQDPYYYDASLLPKSVLEQITVTSAIIARWIAQGFEGVKYIGNQTIKSLPIIRKSITSTFSDATLQLRYQDLPSPPAKESLFSQQAFDQSEIKISAGNTYFVNTKSAIQLTVSSPTPSIPVTYQLSVDPSIATIDGNGLLSIHSTSEPFKNSRLPLLVYASSNGKTGVGQFAIVDTDNDGDMIADTYEEKIGLNPNRKNDLKSDLDGDDLLDVFEANLGTDPLKKDTDGDGYTDLEEYLKGTLPGSSNSYPYPDQIRSVTSGNWHATNTWSCNCIPAPYQEVTITDNHLISVTLEDAQVKRLIYNGGSIKLINPNSKIYFNP
ncbi:hypothetical protein [Spirosoma flavum]|uniref:EF-hand domain-containing protein n=1 Tax=Spirosoma flavum TaxID=2048557 RepID=A0ABW6ARN6_9BACT